ncbi:hypothetical protein HanRHA438_Chr17g0811241 [Helianthus annuus]|uniref:Uncharacterized protein n=1 Tax=Helianthus annuus TaxID=4232 RepID=A0A9K3NVY9_HELAN|nr:hypothetical protein HanXRQr2_Chr17g0801281 [Helianthus annuus]KAF5814581.1 hypothetical protein HanXRQr2_Chr03g0112711 [Helianthus annuus]KAJ0429090.1 hypothetical protein HanHA300_Chr17g0653421 [Helianthus annuus]KAJ0433318.1 hypothetical protein HanIR_Chr17g0868931 [Helianthus annuus]KAJ0447398.1 hypothetical protein HanHA89_Chr17g0704941 [Helianthus annuus]
MAQHATKRQCVSFWFQQNKTCQNQVPRNPTSYSGYFKTTDERRVTQTLVIVTVFIRHQPVFISVYNYLYSVVLIVVTRILMTKEV